MILQGRGISKGKGVGCLVLSKKSVSFLGGVNPADGALAESGRIIAGRVFAFPRGRGSTVGSYILLEMKRQGTLPAAIINETAEPIVATGAVMAGVPLVDLIDLSLLREGDEALVDGEEGTVELPLVREISVVTSLLIFQEKLLLLKRSDKVGSFQRHWAGVSGYIEKDETPLECALKEINEEAGVSSPRLIKKSDPLILRSDEDIWRIHLFLFEVDHEVVSLNWEHTEYKWVGVEEALDHETVPGFDRVLMSLGLKSKD